MSGPLLKTSNWSLLPSLSSLPFYSLKTPLKYKLIHFAPLLEVFTLLIAAWEAAPAFFSVLFSAYFLPARCALSPLAFFSYDAKPIPTSGFYICCSFCPGCSSPRILLSWFPLVFQGSAQRPSLTPKLKSFLCTVPLSFKSVTAFITVRNCLTRVAYCLFTHPGINLAGLTYYYSSSI